MKTNTELINAVLRLRDETKQVICRNYAVSALSDTVLTAIIKQDKNAVYRLNAYITLEDDISDLSTQAKKASTKKVEKNDLEKLVSSAIGIGLLSVYGIKDKEYSNIQLGISNYICRQALDSSNKINAVDNLRQFSGRALTVLQGIEWLHSINIDYDTLETLINAVNIDKDIANGKFTDAARDKINEKIKELGFEITLKEDKEEENKEADKADK